MMEARGTFLRTAYPPLDGPHEELERRVRALGDAVRSGHAEESRGRFRILIRALGEHFSDEEELMRTKGWSQAARHAESHARLLDRMHRLETHLAGRGLTLDFSSWALTGLPAMLRYHTVRSDFGFAMFALGAAQDPGSLPSRGH
jgi:hemerythrin-like metal-binding protein